MYKRCIRITLIDRRQRKLYPGGGRISENRFLSHLTRAFQNFTLTYEALALSAGAFSCFIRKDGDGLTETNAAHLNKITHGDSVEEMRKLADKSVDLVIADPPYGIDFNSNYRKQSTLKSVDGIYNDGKDNTEFLSGIITEIDRVLKDDSHIYWFTRWDRVHLQLPLLERYFTVKNALVWQKNNWSMGDLTGAYAGQYETILFAQKGRRKLNEVDGRKRHTDILQFDRISPQKLRHSHEKPEDLIDFLIRKSSNEDEVILDPFCGSGTTASCAKRLGRNFLTYELDEEYVAIANQRITNAQS